MVEEDRYGIDVVTQINAARAALDKVALGCLMGTCATASWEVTAGQTIQRIKRRNSWARLDG